MEIVYAVFLGILQGLTEFLPVSSSGHLVLAQSVIPGFTQPGITFDVILHAGTLFAVLWYFRKTILKISSRYLFLLGLGTVPAGLVGYFFQANIETLFSGTKLVGFALLVTALLNYLTDKTEAAKDKVSWKNSLIVGIAQAVAIVPGISRSGATIFAGSSVGIKAKKAAEFSFLLSVPAILGANILQFASHGVNGGLSPFFYLVGFVSAFVTGFFAIGWVIKFLLAKKFKLFALYCLVVGALALLL